MTETIRVYSVEETAFRNLELAAEMLTRFSQKGYKYHVGVCYFDFGQSWMWTTILCSRPNSEWGDCQALYPAQQEKIVNAEILTELTAAVNEILANR